MTDDLGAIFREELRDLLESLERGLLDLGDRPDNADLINQVFRDLHTVKGSGAMFGFTALAAFIHDFETMFERVRAGLLPLTPDILRLALAARDEIPRLVDDAPDTDGRRAAIKAAVAALMDQAPPAAAAVAAEGSDAAAGGDRLQRLSFRFAADALGLGAQPLVILQELRGLGATGIAAETRDVPLLDRLQPDQCYVAWTLDLPATVTAAQIEEVFCFADADWKIEPAHQDAAPAEDMAPAGAPARGTAAGANAQPAAPTPIPPPAAAPARAEAPQPQAGATVRVPAERLDALMDAVGELVIVEARLTELARQSRDPALLATAEQITRLAGGLRDATMTMRMVPMRSLVARFRRLVMDLSQQLGKPVAFSVLGEETELDKTLIEKLADPLVHILRNALDHGMETPDERRAAGKPAEGLVELTAEHAGAEVLIRVRDDGRGMDAERIRAKALAQGLIAPDAQLAEAQLFALVLEPGFSTAAQVTELSGRGVGMDVVRRTIEGLRGQIEIDSRLGQGTTVTLRLPLTLAIVEGLLIEVQGERYTLPMAAVHEIVALPAEKRAPRVGGDFLDIRGRFVPFLRLRHLFDCAGEPPTDQNVVIVMQGEARIGIVVDRIVGTNQTVIKQMSKLHAGVRAVSGATILGDGSVALILDVQHLVGMGRAQDGAAREVAA
ncbi:MAG: hypothetical protein RIR62_2873 [Pseudomonadota bacterium]